MKPELTQNECRVLGVMLEKETTTPDQYPLSLNGLTTGCNQKSNREPVMSLSENDVQDTVDSLKAKKLISDQTGFGSRVVKYKHRFCNTEFGDLQFSEQQRALICVLLLRGPQTPGELRTRTQRMAEFSNVAEAESVLMSLTDYKGDQLVTQLPREPGKRESRYAHLFSGEVTATLSHTSNQDNPSGYDATGQNDLVEALAAKVDQLSLQVDELRQRLDALEG